MTVVTATATSEPESAPPQESVARKPAPPRQTWDDGLIARRVVGRPPGPPVATEGRGSGPAGEANRGEGYGQGRDGTYGGGHGGAYGGGHGAAYGEGGGQAYGDTYGDSYRERYGEGDGVRGGGYAGARGGVAREPYTPAYEHGGRGFVTGALRPRLDALRELVGLSRTRLDGRTLGEAGRVLDEAVARGRHPLGHTVVALAGATGSGKSTLFNALAGAYVSEAGIRRPTTATPLACAWTDHADGLLDRLDIPHRDRRRPAYPYDPTLRGLVLIDLPDHDSAAPGHRERVERLLGLVDAVVWVVDPEKYADAVLHERYLRPLAGYAEVTFVVLNQVDRLPGEAADQVLDDLRRLLDEDGLALGEHGEPGATVLALSAVTGAGIGELREALGRLTAECGAAERRLAADVDGAMERLRPQYVADGAPVGFSARDRAEFEERLADAAGAVAAGQAAERAWLRDARWACGTPWGRLGQRRRAGAVWSWEQDRAGGGSSGAGGGTGGVGGASGGTAGGRAGTALEIPGARAKAASVAAVTARPAVEEAVRALADEATAGLPAPWAQAVREAAAWGGKGLPDAVDEAVAATAERRLSRPLWWSVVAAAQVALATVLLVGVAGLLAVVAGVFGGVAWWLPALPAAAAAVGGPALAWGCGLAARGPARRYGLAAEQRLREVAAECGRTQVLEPVTAELARYREVRKQYVIAAGGAVAGGLGSPGRGAELSTTGE
ncbi:YfjP family GTPase [Streptomyces sp. NBS 14/10]|uniref:YfjP family GTPase n=1 Tax=Streptomyces sp. NBS 14/10 TaxID=1945643 RepID=UPI000B7F4C0E|nr:YfjP family GTPase [Streptomyces sp. NBS 14/10]KAK1179290.1 YfjP family GTPase [Streptomyces sp. NBS 14/10]